MASGMPFKADIAGYEPFKPMGQELVEWHVVMRIEGKPVVIVGKKVAFTTYPFNLGGKGMPVLTGNVFQDGVAEYEINSAILYRKMTAVCHNRMVISGIIRAIDF